MSHNPTPMALGPFHFRSFGFSFDATKDDLQTPWADIELADRMDALQWTGPKSAARTITGVLFPAAFGGQDTLTALKRAAKAGTPLMLVTFAGDVHGLHAVQSVSADNAYIDASGLQHKQAYTITLRSLEP